MQSFAPGLENLQRVYPVAGKGARLHLGAHRLFAEFVKGEHAVGKLLDLLAVAGAPAPIHEQHQAVADARMPAGPLRFAPEHEAGGVRHLEPIKKGGHIQRRRDVVAQDLAAIQAVEVDIQLGKAPAHAVGIGVEHLLPERRPQRRKRRRDRVPSV